MKGFFSDTVWTAQKSPLPLVANCGACGLFRSCNSPKMPTSGSGRRGVLIIAEAPGDNEDRKGIQLCGNAGVELARILYKFKINLRSDCFLENAVICRPSNEDGSNRTPTDDEVDWCRPNVRKTIETLNPDIIIPLGERAVRSLIPLAWKEGEVDKMARWAGWQIPCQKLNCWICPTYHPSYLLHSKEPVGELIVTKHLHAAFQLKGKPWPDGVPNWEKQIEIVMDSDRAAEFIRLMMKPPHQPCPLAFDYETTHLKPDKEEAAILCCSISDGTATIAYPWLGEAIVATKEFLQSDIPKVGANIQFEERWTRKKLGCRVRNWHWDVVLNSHVLDCRHGINSVKFQSFVQLGMSDYDSHIEPYKESRDGSSNSPNRLREIEPAVLMKYNGLDALFEAMLYKKQKELIDID